MPDREVMWVRRLFERAIGGFYAVSLTPKGWTVRRGGALQWPVDHRTAGIDKILPTMRTDVVLDHPATARRIVIDTKFTSIVTSGWYREETLRSGYVYQIYAYLRSQVGRGDLLADQPLACCCIQQLGVIDEAVVIQGHKIRFATVDLAATAIEIRSQLLQLFQPPVPTAVPLA
jgi:5-methylcytosine-specific restriction enzyme subunit McrC